MTEHVSDSLVIWRAYCDKKMELEDAQDRIEILERNLERMLLEFDFLIEGGYIRDCRNDIIFEEAREALGKKAMMYVNSGCNNACGSVICSQHGCQKVRGANLQSICLTCGLHSWQTCSNAGCTRGLRSHQTYPGPNYAEIFAQFQTQKGCICPPGANKECENQYCPRKALPISAFVEVKK